MLKAVPARDFFSINRPSGIPSDSPAPDFNLLIEMVQSIRSAQYPLHTLKEILFRENTCLGAGQAAIEAIRSIDDTTIFIAAGQQAGLFGGPLYTLYKAMHAVRLAAVLTEKSGRRVIPLFWVASDDHDFEEVKSIGVRSRTGDTLRIEYVPETYHSGLSIGKIILDKTIHDFIKRLETMSPAREMDKRYFDFLRDSWVPGRSWSDAFAHQMAGMFRDNGLVVCDPRWDGMKKLFLPVMMEELEQPLVSSSIINQSVASIPSSKRRKAIHKPRGATNLFMEHKGARQPIYFDSGRFKAGETEFSQEELIHILLSSPELFSPGAILRPVCQDAVFPVAAQISGPGERVYLSQLDDVYKHFNVNRSLVWPRASFTIIDPRTMRTCDKEHVPLNTLFADVHHIKLHQARLTFPEDLGKSLDSLESAVTEGFDAVSSHIGTLDPTLIDTVRKDKAHVLQTVHTIRNRAVRVHKDKLVLGEGRLTTASYFLLPDNGPQERWFGADAILTVLDGTGFHELITLTSPGEECHRIVWNEQ